MTELSFYGKDQFLGQKPLSVGRDFILGKVVYYAITSLILSNWVLLPG